jgi:hypothetical protein
MANDVRVTIEASPKPSRFRRLSAWWPSLLLILFVAYLTGPQIHIEWQDERTFSCPSGQTPDANGACRASRFGSSTTTFPAHRHVALGLLMPTIRIFSFNWASSYVDIFGFGLCGYTDQREAEQLVSEGEC